jgi:hypothetical protein
MPICPRTVPRPRPRAGWPAAVAAAAAAGLPAATFVMEGLRVGGAAVAPAAPRGGAEFVGDGAEADGDGTGAVGEPSVGADADEEGSPVVSLEMLPAFLHSSICFASSLTPFCALTSWVSFNLSFIVPPLRPLSTAFSRAVSWLALDSASLAEIAVATATRHFLRT